MYITEKEKNALLEAVDFIRTNSDGADDYEPFDELCNTLHGIFDKAKKDIEKRNHKQLVKKYLKELTVPKK